jgi:hypothetical protein
MAGACVEVIPHRGPVDDEREHQKKEESSDECKELGAGIGFPSRTRFLGNRASASSSSAGDGVPKDADRDRPPIVLQRRKGAGC